MRRKRRLIISTLAGGLGNQMFQYAAGRALALRRGSELQLDVSWLERPWHTTPRRYELEGFQHLQAKLIDAYRHPRRQRLRELVGLAPPVWRHKAFDFDPKVLALPGYVRLVGYWQSEKYFEDYKDVIRSDFAFGDGFDLANRATAREIQACTAVSVHVRRGDYVSNPEVSGFHGSLPLDYYRSAAELIRAKAPEAHFFVFSDDSSWCRTHLDLGSPTIFVDHNRDRPAEDMRLMTLCQHHIIANSSFSWWGAWLSSGHDKILVAPKRWAAAVEVSPDLVPERWIRL